MRVGIVSKWFNRGQPIVGRYIRSAVDELGHQSFVLARPRREQGPAPGALERTGIWDQPGVTEASAFEAPASEYLAWVEANEIGVVLCDQNYQFSELAELRRRGVRVIGRFVWEHFTEEHLAGAREAYDVIYSVTECEQRRYASWGLDTPRVPCGIHPELLEIPVEQADDGITRFIFPGGFLGHRKPLEPVAEAFARTANPDIRLLVKAQVERNRLGKLSRKVRKDRRIEFLLGDEEWRPHLITIAACDVSITPSRWEGLGLPLYEAMAFGQPVISNDDPPMNEVISDGLNGLLVPSHPDGTARSGIPAKRPDPEALTVEERTVLDHWQQAESEALVAVFGPHRHLDEGGYEIRLDP